MPPIADLGSNNVPGAGVRALRHPADQHIVGRGGVP